MTNDLSLRKLAAAVLSCALYDAAGLAAPFRRGSVRGSGKLLSAADVAREAYAWLTTPSERLEFWSEAAGLDMKTVIDGADAGIDYARRTPRSESVWSSARRVRKS